MLYKLTEKGQRKLVESLRYLTQEELADKVGVSRQTLRKLLTGGSVFETTIRRVLVTLELNFDDSMVKREVRHNGLRHDNFCQFASQKQKLEAQLNKLRIQLKGVMTAQSMSRVFDFVSNLTAQGKVVNVTDHYSSTHILTNDNLTAERAIWTPAQFNLSRICYEPMWREAGSGNELDYLIEELPKVGEGNCIQEYNYNLLRMPREGQEKGDPCRYWPTIYYFSDFIGGRPVRVSVSHPSDYEVLA